MKKNKNILIVLFYISLLIISIVFFYNKTKNKNFNLEESNENIEWNLYHNEDLGFSIKVPLKVATVCKCPNNAMVNVPIKIFENDKKGIVYITPEYYYDASWSSEEQKFTKECTKIIYSSDMLEVKEVKKPFLGWKFNINNIESEEDLLMAIKDNFGSTCEIKDKVKDEQGNYEISLYGSDWDFNDGLESRCMINYSYRIIFCPNKGKMMSVILGQECTFGTDPNIKSYYCYDEDMINSFRFY
jgi:hypothetical protein